MYESEIKGKWWSAVTNPPAEGSWVIIAALEHGYVDDESGSVYGDEYYVTIALYKDGWHWSGGNEQEWEGITEIPKTCGNKTERFEVIAWRPRPARPYIPMIEK